MQRYRNYDVAIAGGIGELIAEEFRERFLERLIESIFVPPDERRQRSAIARCRRTIARDRAGAGEVRPLVEAQCAPVLAGICRLHWGAANRADWLGDFLNARQAWLAYAARGLESEAIAADRASRRIEKIRNMPERRIHAQ